jgi:hypothetical protein
MRFSFFSASRRIFRWLRDTGSFIPFDNSTMVESGDHSAAKNFRALRG